MLIVNLSSTHDYSIDETIAAFVDLCDEHSNACLKSMPGFFQRLTNYTWVKAQFSLNYKSLIEPYKLGKISTDQFLDGLSNIFYFMSSIDRDQRHELLTKAWNSSIKTSLATHGRLNQLIDEARTQPVYLVSNTNPLNVLGIIELFMKNAPAIRFNRQIDISVQDSKEPIEILPNVYLCLSYRYGAFKQDTGSTMGLIEHVINNHNSNQPITVISQFPQDLKKAEQLGIQHRFAAEEFYTVNSDLMKKMN